MIGCRETQALLWELLDGELNDAVYHEHLSRCPHCGPAYRYHGALLIRIARCAEGLTAPTTLVIRVRALLTDA